MQKNIFHSTIIFIISVTLFNCSSPSEPIQYSDSYTPLYKGLEKDYVSLEDSVRLFTSVVGNVIREDGQHLYIKELKYLHYKNNEVGFSSHPSYQYLKKDFLYSTRIVETDDNSNLFAERRFAKANPKNSERWKLSPDNSAKKNWVVEAIYIGDMQTPAGLFSDVYNFQLIDSTFGFKDTVKSYFAKGFGNIATYSSDLRLVVNYIKTKDAEYGERIYW